MLEVGWETKRTKCTAKDKAFEEDVTMQRDLFYPLRDFKSARLHYTTRAIEIRTSIKVVHTQDNAAI